MGEEILWPPQDDTNVFKVDNSAPVLDVTSHQFQQSVPMVSLAEAVRESTKSRGTIRRWIADGKIEGAVKTDAGWKIPIASLVTSGAWDGQSKPENTRVESQNTDKVSDLEMELLRVRLELNSEKKLREAAERNADDLRFAMRMLTSGETPSSTQMPRSADTPRTSTHSPQRIDRFDFSPASILDAANKFKKRLLG